MRFIVNKTKTVIAAAMVLFFFGYGIFFIVTKNMLGAVAFLLLTALFAWVLYRNARTVTVDGDGVRQNFLGFELHRLPWNLVREMGLIGEGVFNRKGKSGDKYIYFSPTAMTPDERFNLIVRWPPKKDILYFEYSEKALETHDQYSVFLGGNNARTDISSGAGTGRSISNTCTSRSGSSGCWASAASWRRASAGAGPRRSWEGSLSRQ